MTQPLFTLKNVSHRYPESPGVKSLDDVSLEISSGDFISLVGSVGSGKTTLLKLLVGLLKPSGGTITFDGAPVPAKGPKLRELRRRVGMVFQFAENQVFEATALEEVAYGLKNFGFPKDKIGFFSQNALNDVSLPAEDFAEKSPFELSGGERKRLALASILALQPELLLLDEPAAGLDGAGRRRLMKILENHRTNGRGVIMVTHDLDLAAESCEKVMILHRGKMVFQGNRDIFYDFHSLKEWELHPPELMEAWAEIVEKGDAPSTNVFSLEEAKSLLKKH